MRPIDQAIAAHQAGNLAQAETLYRAVLKSNRRDFDALHMLGIICAQRGQYEESEQLLRSALKVDPAFVPCHHNYGNVLVKLGRYKEALASYDKALAIAPQYAPVYSDRGNVLKELGRLEDALASYDKALTLNPNDAMTHYNRGIAFEKLGRSADALASYERAVALNPNYPEAHCNRGIVLETLKRFAEASASYDRALALKPDLAEAWVGRGNIFLERNQHDDALAAYDRAVTFNPGLAEAWAARGVVFIKLRRFDEAFVAYDKAVALNPELKDAQGYRIYAKLNLCQWKNLDAEVSRLLAAIGNKKSPSQPFALLSIASSSADQMQCARSFVASQPPVAKIWRGEGYSHDRIRVAYLSADLRDHPVGYLSAGLFELHDKARFETTAISFGPADNSNMRRRMMNSFERFEHVETQNDQDVAALIRRLEIDIAVDLNGMTDGARPNILARRPAPIQVSYLGYAGTTGADHIDYILGDSTVIPDDQSQFYSEKVVWLPDSYLVNDSTRPISDHMPTRRECGLPEIGFVFCCFNNAYKISPELFDVWMRLLKATDGSVLWLAELNATAMANLRREAEARGVASNRLIFAPKMPAVADHLARQRLADLFVDTLPYNAHTTACDALWVGLPVLTCLGSTFAGRVAASVLKAVGLDELVTDSLDEYETLARKLAHNPSLIASLKDKLARNRKAYPLFDTERFARHIESAFVTMMERHRSGAPPQGFAVDPIK